MAAVTSAVMAGTIAAASGAYANKPKVKADQRKEEPSAAIKCPSCGSHQFVMHVNRRICFYCRSEG